MRATRQDLSLGLVLTALFALAYFVLIPVGIEIPRAYDSGQLSPASYPSWIALTGLCASLLLTFNAARSYLKLRRAAAKPEEKPSGLRGVNALPGILGYTLLFVFFFFIDEVGMILGSFVLYAVFARLCGERNWLRLLLVDVLLTAALYVFFVRIASVPIPLGILQSLL